MTLLSANFQDLIDEQKEKNKQKKKKKKTKTIKVWKFNPEIGYDELTEVKTPDSGTFVEMYERYGNEYPYRCAMFPPVEMLRWVSTGRWRPYKLFPDPEKAKEELESNPRRYNHFDDPLENEPQLNPLSVFGDHIAWIDVIHNCILVEKAV